jgi:hypothetical protein
MTAKKNELPVAEVLEIAPNQPYPVGNPPDNRLVVERVHTPQERVSAADRIAQSQANLAAGGHISGGAAFEAPKPKAKAKAKPDDHYEAPLIPAPKRKK